MRIVLSLLSCFLLLGSAMGQEQNKDKKIVENSDYPTILELTKGDIINALSLKTRKGHVVEIPTSLYCPKITHRAIFCKMEDKMLRSAKLPLKVRLGDVQYTDKLEGKNAFDRFSPPN